MHRTGYSSDDFRGVDGQENACPPVGYISDLIRVFFHSFQLAVKVIISSDRTMNIMNRQTGTQRQRIRSTYCEPPMAQSSPQETEVKLLVFFASCLVPGFVVLLQENGV